MNKEWTEKNKLMQSLLKKAAFDEGIVCLLELRSMIMDDIRSWKYDLDPKDYWQMPFINADGYHSKTIAYSLWHIMRIEDIVVNSLILNREEIFFSGGFSQKIRSDIITTGNELYRNEIAEFSRKLDLVVLFQYAEAVKSATDSWLGTITFDDLKRKFTDDDRERLRSLKVVSTDKNAEWLIDYWCGKDIKGLIRMPLSRHWIMHTEAADRIKKKLTGTSGALQQPIKSGTLASGITYYIYKDTDGSVYAQTQCCRYCHLADSMDEYLKIPALTLENKIYSAEMSSAR